MVVVVDTSVWIDFLGGRVARSLAASMATDRLVLPPLAVAELVTGAGDPSVREKIGDLLQEFPLHPTPLSHWIALGNLRRLMALNGISVSIPDGHIAQCALDRDAILLSRDAIFDRIVRYFPLRLEKP